MSMLEEIYTGTVGEQMASNKPTEVKETEVLIPLGMSGLKFRNPYKGKGARLSHPAWDEWIEMPKFEFIINHIDSHPAWDEWIEIFYRFHYIDIFLFSSRLG